MGAPRTSRHSISVRCRGAGQRRNINSTHRGCVDPGPPLRPGCVGGPERRGGGGARHDEREEPAAEGDPAGGRRRGQVLPHEPLRHRPLRLAVLPHHRRGVPQPRPGGGRPPGHAADLGHGGPGALQVPAHALLPRRRLLPAHLRRGRPAELPEPGRLEEGVHVLLGRQGPRALPLRRPGQQGGHGAAGGGRGGGAGLVRGERLLPVLRDQRQGRHQRHGGLRGGCARGPGRRGPDRPRPAERHHRSPRQPQNLPRVLLLTGARVGIS